MKINSISIITPVYNNYKYLEKSLPSLFNQKINKNIVCNLFIIDDGSDFFDKEFVENIIKKNNVNNYNVEIIINEKNIGTVKTLNKVLKLQNSDLIVPLTADDEYHNSSVVQSCIDFFNKTDYLIPATKRLPISNGVPLEPLPKKNEILLFKDRKKLLKYISKKGNIISGASTFYRKELLAKIGYFDERYKLLEDYPFYLKILSNNIDIGFIDIITMNYGTTGISSLKGKKVNTILQNEFKLVAEHIVNNYDFLSYNEKRIITYNRILDHNKKNSLNIKYLDLLLLLKLKNIVKYTMAFLRK